VSAAPSKGGRPGNSPTGKPVVFVVGASGDLGLDLCEHLAQQNACVVAGYRTRPERLQELAGNADRVRGGAVEPVAIETTDLASLERAVDAAFARHGRLDALVFMSAILKDNLLSFMSEADWDAVVDTNLKGAFLACKAAVRPMLNARAGRIVLVSSLSGLRGVAGQANYCASKAGLTGLARALAHELARFRVLVNVVAPGLIDSNVNEQLGEKRREALLAGVALRRVGQKREVSSLIRWLVLDPDATYVTGQVISVDGGSA
jgi:3-oxoacyl-[acyl-carrier protein] reductase